jgi:hypothetical protein
MKRILVFTFLAANLLFMILSNSVGAVQSFCDFYNYEKDSKVYKGIARLIDKPVVSNYLAISGFETGYGFFAPNVCSQIHIAYDFIDSTGKLIAQKAPEFDQHEGFLRFTTCYTDFVNAYFEPEPDSLSVKISDAMIKCVGRNMAKKVDGCSDVEANVYLYEYPKLSDSPDTCRPSFVNFRKLKIKAS